MEKQELQKEIYKITRKIENPGAIVSAILTKIEEYGGKFLKVEYKPKNFKLIIKLEGKEQKIDVIENIGAELNKKQKELVELFTYINRRFYESKVVPYMPEVHLSKEESTKHHPKKLQEISKEVYEKYREIIERNYEGNLYRELLRSI